MSRLISNFLIVKAGDLRLFKELIKDLEVLSEHEYVFNITFLDNHRIGK